MEPETASQQQTDPRAGALGPESTLKVVTLPRLSEEQSRVLECLRKEGGGLTARQIQSRLGCAPAVVENALVVLLERQFVSRLNTLVPSYALRLDGVIAGDG